MGDMYVLPIIVVIYCYSPSDDRIWMVSILGKGREEMTVCSFLPFSFINSGFGVSYTTNMGYHVFTGQRNLFVSQCSFI